MSNNLYFTCGLSHSGKSTLAQKWLKYENYIDGGQFHEYERWRCSGKVIDSKYVDYDLANQRRVVVSGDAIRESLGSLWNPNVEDYVDSIKYTMVKALLKTGHTVLIDETNTSERSIRRILEIDIGAQVAVVPTSKEECLKRADISLHKPIERMWINLTKITYPYPVNKQTVINGINLIKQLMISHKENFTNEPIRDTTAKNTELPKVSPVSEPPRTNETCYWSYTSPIIPEPNFQVY